MAVRWTPGRGARGHLPRGFSTRWRYLLGQAAKGAQAAYLMILLEERYPTSGSQREETEREAVREARIAATAALLLLKEGGSVGMARLSLSQLPDPHLRSALAPAVLAAHRLEASLILDQMASGLEFFLEALERGRLREVCQ